LLDLLFGRGVKTADPLIQEQHSRFMSQRTRQGLLTTNKR